EHVPTFYYVTKDIPDEVWSAGCRTLKAFGASSRFFHLEFFRLTKAKEGLGEVGDIVALEVNMRPAGGYTPDMLNFAGSVDVYQIWADMVVYDRCVHDFDGPRSYCIYAGRRDEFTYVHSGADIRTEYKDHLKIVTRMPDSLADAMGNQVFIACFDTLEETRAFASYCFKEA
ncbi:MAG: carbamoylphosphate synthase large subunit, partial [Firmicutes bacterium]|nr:carbamoylphosphate synthase large subunit [Bacillota bacterium]